jgi:hypothetical protein
MKLRYFKNDLVEFACKETGNNLIQESFVHALDDLRDACGFPFVITSGYRDPSHSAEINKSQPGQHCLGIAADIAVSGNMRLGWDSGALALPKLSFTLICVRLPRCTGLIKRFEYLLKGFQDLLLGPHDVEQRINIHVPFIEF